MTNAHTKRPSPLVVIKVGGSLQDHRAQMRRVCADIAAARTLGYRAIVVHGGGKAINAAMSSAGLTPRFVNGQRYTDDATLAIVERVLCGTINAEIVSDLGEHARAVGCTSIDRCVLFGVAQGTTDKDGRSVDLGRVGRVTRVETKLLDALCGEAVPVIAPIALDGRGGKLNVNADLAAGEVAAAMHAEVFMLVSDTAGVRTVPSDPASRAPTLTLAGIEALRRTGAIDGGMIPKTDAAGIALRAGTKPAPTVWIIDGREPGAILDTLQGRPAPGTRILP